MTEKVLSKQNLNIFINTLLSRGEEIVGVKKKEGQYAFGKIADAEEVCLDYDITLLPPSMYLLPQREALLKFNIAERPVASPVIEANPFILFGVHPYDIKAIELLDTAFSTDNLDTNYLSRREAATIIGVDCLNPNPNAFCPSMDTAFTDKGYDLLLTDIGDSYVIAIGSEKGQELLKGCPDTQEATQVELKRKEEERQKALGQYKVALDTPLEKLPQLLDKSWNSSLWEERSEACLSCGSCVMVCPTCFCFDVQDDIELDLVEGERYRQKDACMLVDFAAVAGGGNFRDDKTSRYRHRMYRKGKYIMERFGKPGCVGCGRCASACLAEIASPAETFNLMRGESK